MSLIYDKYTVDEWMEQHVEPLMKLLNSLMQRAQTLTNAEIWPRRPLNFKKLSAHSKSASASQPVETDVNSLHDILNQPANRDVVKQREERDGNDPIEGNQQSLEEKQITNVPDSNTVNTYEENITLHPEGVENEKLYKEVRLSQSNS